MYYTRWKLSTYTTEQTTTK